MDYNKLESYVNGVKDEESMMKGLVILGGMLKGAQEAQALRALNIIWRSAFAWCG